MAADPLRGEGAARLLRLIASKLEDWMDGDELALETLGEALESAGFTADDLQAAALAMRAAGGEGPGEGWIADGPGQGAERVLSAEEREALSTEAWGYLLSLRRRGELDAAQLERVLEALHGSGVRPVEMELARDVAARVVLEHGDRGEEPHGDVELAH
jgi:uncharacterized protein Smg (DUF494 family)